MRIDGRGARSRAWRAALLLSVASIAIVTAAKAQDAAPAKPSTGIRDKPGAVVLEEIVVEQQPTFGTKEFVATRSTAGMKSNMSILETPASVSVVTRDELNVRGAQDLNIALGYTPNVKVTDYPGGQGGPAITIRGFRNINYESVYEDGLRYGFNSFDKDIDPNVYERIDVIKGPISVLYGQGQPGGIVNVVSKLPTFTAQNEVYIQGGSFNRIQGGFDLSGPIKGTGVSEGSETLAFRVAGIVRDADTQVAFSPDRRVFIAPALTWRPDAATNLTILGKYSNVRRGGSEQSLPILGSIQPSQAGFFQRNVFTGIPSFNKESLEDKSIGYLFDYAITPKLLYHSAARYSNSSTDYNAVGALGGTLLGNDRLFPIFPYARFQRSNGVVTDNHLDGRFDTFGFSHNAVAGVDFQTYRRTDSRFFSTPSLLDLYNPVYPTGVTLPTTPTFSQVQNIQQTGIYAQDQIKFGGGFIFTGSVRNDWATNKTNFVSAAATQSLAQRATATSFRTALGYEFPIGLVPYVSYSTSFNIVPGTTSAGLPFDPSKAKQIEGGAKYQPDGSNSIYTFSLFDITQTNIPSPDPVTPGFAVQTGEARSRGMELESKTAVTKNLNAIFAYAHLETVVTKDNINPATGLSNVGNQLANVPNNTVSTFLDYTFPVGTALSGLRAGAGFRFVGRTTDTTNIDRIPAYTLVDASASYDFEKLNPRFRGVTLSVNALNLFDKRYFTSGFYQGTVLEGFRRVVFTQLSYKW